MHIRPVVIAKKCNLDIWLSNQVLKVLMHHECITLQVIFFSIEFFRVADHLSFEIRYFKVNCVKVLFL